MPHVLTSADHATTTLLRSRRGKYLTFFLDDEEYGLEILTVHEIIGVMPVTRMPRTPEYILGVINLRGKVISIMDLRARFGIESATELPESCIIVVQVSGLQMGLYVDRVSEVLDIQEADIEDPPAFSADTGNDCILGVAKTGGRVKLLLDIHKVLYQPASAGAPTVALQPTG